MDVLAEFRVTLELLLDSEQPGVERGVTHGRGDDSVVAGLSVDVLVVVV